MTTTTPKRKTNLANANGRAIGGVASMNAYVKSIADIMRRSGRAGALQYVPEMTWMIFLRVLDEREQREAAEVAALGKRYSPTLDPPYRWFDWAAPYDPAIKDAQGRTQGWKRKQLQDHEFGAVMRFVNEDLIPTIRRFENSAMHGSRQLQKAIGRLKLQLRQAATREEWDAPQTQIDHHSAEQRAIVKQARELANEAQGILDAIYDLKAVNPHAADTGDRRTPDELLKVIEEAQREISAGISALRAAR